MISLLTPTGDRPAAFAECERYVWWLTKDLRHEWEWIVVDDGLTSSVEINVPWGDVRLKTEVIRPKPLQAFYLEKNTQCRNLLEALKACRGEYVFIIEDDDCYGKNYIAESLEHLKAYELVGETPSRYYNVATRCYKEFLSDTHASLCQTSFQRSVIPTLVEACQNRLWIDVTLWKNFKGSKKLYAGSQVVGIKGLPGRAGIGKAHTRTNQPAWSSDKDLTVLRSWIGFDTESYQKYYQGENNVKRVGPKEIEKIDPNDPLLPPGVRADKNSGDLQTFMWCGQIRYKCPDCGFDGPTLVDVRKHWVATHKTKEKDSNMGATLFDADDRPIPKQVNRDIPDVLKGIG